MRRAAAAHEMRAARSQQHFASALSATIRRGCEHMCRLNDEMTEDASASVLFVVCARKRKGNGKQLMEV